MKRQPSTGSDYGESTICDLQANDISIQISEAKIVAGQSAQGYLSYLTN